MNIMSESDLVFARESTNSCESIWELLYQVISGPMDLAAMWTGAGLAVVVETGAGLGGFVPGDMIVMAQFIFTTASFLHEGRPRMAGLGVSMMYQYEFTL